jgi:hypothetical protein
VLLTSAEISALFTVKSSDVFHCLSMKKTELIEHCSKQDLFHPVSMDENFT